MLTYSLYCIKAKLCMECLHLIAAIYVEYTFTLFNEYPVHTAIPETHIVLIDRNIKMKF